MGGGVMIRCLGGAICVFAMLAGVFVLAIQGAPGGPIRVAFVAALTGPSAFGAEMARQGVILAVEEINKRGGVLGRQLDLTVQDTKANPVEAVSAIRRLVAQDGIKLILGPHTSSEVLATMPVLNELKAVAITTLATSPVITQQMGKGGDPWMFRAVPPDDTMARALINMAVTRIGDKRLGIVARNDDFGRGIVTAFAKFALAEGAVITSTNFYTSGGSYDFSSTLTRLKQENPQAVAFVGTIEEAIPFIKQFAEQGLKAHIYLRGAQPNQFLYEQLGPLVNGIYSVEPYFSEIDSKENRDFIARFKARWNRDPIFHAPLTYAAAYILVDAIQLAGTDDPGQVRDKLSKVRYHGVTGDMVFDEFNQVHPNIYAGRVQCAAGHCQVVVISSAR